uniref:Ancient ubiquitous protein 2 n=1 Tax=Schistosoma japonicum TaxID=6182 RepID=C1LLN7_SCHJA|nr:Ancient ubiquitous protein 2 [Schistosoma japonicum]
MRIIFPYGILVLPYTPLGLVVMILRLVVFAHAVLASWVLSQFDFFRRFVLRSMSTVLGFVVCIDSELRTDQNTCMPFVSNHVTLFDHLVLCLSEDCITPNTHVFRWKSIPHNKEKVCSVSEFILRCARDNHQPAHLLPERAPSGFSDCLFKFDHKMFASVDKVQPVALKVHRIFPIKLVVHPVSWLVELLWQFFTPFTNYHVKYLTPLCRMPGEIDIDFCERVRLTIATSLGATLSPINAEHLADYTGTESQISSLSYPTMSSSSISSLSATPPSSPLSRKHSTSLSSDSLVSNFLGSDGVRLRHNPKSTHESPETYSSFAFEHLIPQISEILRDISVTRIREALVNTQGDVESAIDYLLENSNETDTQRDDHQIDKTMSILSPSRLRVAAPQFMPNSNSRQLSLNERREALLSHARQSYLSRQLKST